jgi:hypothetical protein
MRIVIVRIGIHRTHYHTDDQCPALNSKPETYGGREEMNEHEAQEQGLKLCTRCKR